MSHSVSLSCHREVLIQQAHQDDIHGLAQISAERFVSGSKDGSIRIWTTRGVAETLPTRQRIDYTQWITALSPSSRPDYFLSGTRDGRLELRDHQGVVLTGFQHKSAQNVEGCKERNQNRISCIAPSEEQGVFIGTSGHFTHYDLEKGESLSQCTTSERDWVYCIHPFSRDRVLAVTGTELEMWECRSTLWRKIAVIQSQREQAPRVAQRPFISAVTQLSSNPNHFGIAVFDGSIRVRDVVERQEIIRYQEHVGRTWAVANIAPAVIASCADDAMVKFWDLRRQRSILTLADFPGRVSCLLSLDEQKLITASCPNNPRTSRTKAELAFWDLRSSTKRVEQDRSPTSDQKK